MKLPISQLGSLWKKFEESCIMGLVISDKELYDLNILLIGQENICIDFNDKPMLGFWIAKRHEVATVIRNRKTANCVSE